MVTMTVYRQLLMTNENVIASSAAVSRFVAFRFFLARVRMEK